MKFEWHEIDWLPENTIRTWRAKVIGGWIVRTETWMTTESISESSVFVLDAEHKWEIDNE